MIYSVSDCKDVGLGQTYILPIKGQREKPKAFVVGGTTKQIGEHRSRVTCSVHASKARDGHRVEPRPYVSGQEFPAEHASKTIPENSQWLGILQVLPMKSLEGLDGGKIAPVHGINMPDSDGS